MFDDQQSNQSQNNGSAHDGSIPTLGMNPSSGFSGPTDSSVPSMTPQAQQPQDDTAAQTDHQPQDDSGHLDHVDPTPTVTLPSDNQASGQTPGNYNPQLDDIKRQALSQLSPLVGQLDQSPEERYKTIMMMIQASDNQDLIGEAYTAAQNITDNKTRAEALLNIVNEINYFSQKSQHEN